MGFWSTLGTVASAAGNAAKKKMEKINSLVEEYDNESDDYVKRKLQNGTFDQKMAAGKVLKSRGYTIQDGRIM